MKWVRACPVGKLPSFFFLIIEWFYHCGIREEANLPQPQRHYRLSGESFKRSLLIAAALYFRPAPARKPLSFTHSETANRVAWQLRLL
jgi:hypothetical protein